MKQALKLVTAPHARVGAVPPHALEAEAAIIGVALVAPELAPRLVALVREEHMYDPAHRDVWRAAVSLTQSGTPLDVVTLAAWLREHGDFARVGGATGLARLLDAAPSLAHWEAHARLVRDRYLRRRVIAEAQTIAAEGYGDVGEDERAWCRATVERLRGAASELSEESDTGIGAALKEAAQEAIASQGDAPAVSCPTGLVSLDGTPGCMYGLHAGEVVLVTGKSGRGKTALACNTMALATSRVGRTVGIISAEMPRRQLVMRQACTVARVSLGRVRSRSLDPSDYDRLAIAFGELSRLPMYIDDRKAPTLEDIESQGMRWAEDAARDGAPLGALVIDYLGKIDLRTLRQGRDDRDCDLYTRATSRLIVLAERLGCAVVLLAQLNDQGAIRGSRGPEHDCHWWLDIERDEKKGARWAGQYEPELSHVVVRKARHGESGARCEAWFHGPYVAFSDDDRRFDR